MQRVPQVFCLLLYRLRVVLISGVFYLTTTLLLLHGKTGYYMMDGLLFHKLTEQLNYLESI